MDTTIKVLLIIEMSNQNQDKIMLKEKQEIMMIH